VLNPLMFASSPKSKTSAQRGDGGNVGAPRPDDESSDDESSDDDNHNSDGGESQSVEDNEGDLVIDSSSDDDGDEEEGSGEEDAGQGGVRTDPVAGQGGGSAKLDTTDAPQREDGRSDDGSDDDDDGLGQSDDEDEVHEQWRAPSPPPPPPPAEQPSGRGEAAGGVAAGQGEVWDAMAWRTLPKEEPLDDDDVITAALDPSAKVGSGSGSSTRLPGSSAKVAERDRRHDHESASVGDAARNDDDDDEEDDEEAQEEEEEEVLGTDEDEPEDMDIVAEKETGTVAAVEEEEMNARGATQATSGANEIIPPPSPQLPPIAIHPFASSGPPLPFPTSLSDSFTALVLRRARDVATGASGGGRGGSGPRRGAFVSEAGAIRFTGAAEYAAYHRTLVLEDCASAAWSTLATAPRSNRLVTRWVVCQGYAAAATHSLAESGSLAWLVLQREMQAETGGKERAGGGAALGGGGRGGNGNSNGNTSTGVPSTDDLVEVRSAAAGSFAGWGTLAATGSVLGVVRNVAPDGSRLGVQVLASALVDLESLAPRGGAAVRLGVTLTTSRREFEAVHAAPPSLIAPLLAPLLTGEPYYAGTGSSGGTAVKGDGSIPGTTQPAAALPARLGLKPGNLDHVEGAVARWLAAGRFNTSQAVAILRCVCPGVIDSHGGDGVTWRTVRPCAGVALLHGPPGTGKTRTLVGAVSALLLCKPQPRILVCTPSNAAIDELATRLAAGRLDADGVEVHPERSNLISQHFTLNPQC